MELATIQKEITKNIGTKENFAQLMETTFKGLSPENARKAMFEGYLRKFTFSDFLEKNIYAIPFKDGYSLVSSIDHARKVGMRSGITGKDEPVYVDDKEGKPLTCSVTVHKTINGSTGNFTSKVYFSEFSTGKNLWVTKPRTMIAKVAEMHALRMACPEELAQSYVEEELKKETEKKVIDLMPFKTKLEAAKSMDELKTIWASLPSEAKKQLDGLKVELKKKFEAANSPAK